MNITGFNRAQDQYLQPPDPKDRVCECGCYEDEHDEDGCNDCKECDGFVEQEPCAWCHCEVCQCDAIYDAYEDSKYDD